MARSRHLPFYALVLGAMCLVGAGAGLTDRTDTVAAEGAPLAAVSSLHPATAPAVLPAQAAEELRAATQLSPLRALLIMGMLAGLVGLPAALRHRAGRPGRARRALLARRHAICLRAPPLHRLA